MLLKLAGVRLLISKFVWLLPSAIIIINVTFHRGGSSMVTVDYNSICKVLCLLGQVYKPSGCPLLRYYCLDFSSLVPTDTGCRRPYGFLIVYGWSSLICPTAHRHFCFPSIFVSIHVVKSGRRREWNKVIFEVIKLYFFITISNIMIHV